MPCRCGSPPHRARHQCPRHRRSYPFRSPSWPVSRISRGWQAVTPGGGRSCGPVGSLRAGEPLTGGRVSGSCWIRRLLVLQPQFVDQLGRSVGVSVCGFPYTKNATTGVRHSRFSRQPLLTSSSPRQKQVAGSVKSKGATSVAWFGRRVVGRPRRPDGPGARPASGQCSNDLVRTDRPVRPAPPGVAGNSRNSVRHNGTAFDMIARSMRGLCEVYAGLCEVYARPRATRGQAGFARDRPNCTNSEWF